MGISPKQSEFAKKALEGMETLLRSVFAAELDPILQEIPSPEEEFRIVREELEKNSDWTEIIIKYVQGIRKSQDPIPFELALRFFGLQNARAFLVAYRLSVVMPVKLLEKGKEGVSLAQPISSLIRFAPLTLIRFGEDSRYKQIAYASGLVFDMLYLKLSESSEGPAGLKKLSEALGTFHERACKEASLAIDLARFRKKLPLEKYIVGVSMLEWAARAAMNFIDPGFFSNWNSYEKAGIPHSGRNLIFRDSLGGEPWMLSFALASMFQILHGLVPSLRVISFPAMVKDPKLADSRDVAAVCLTARELIAKKAGKYENEKFSATTFRPEIKGFELTIDKKELEPLIKKALG